MPQHNVIADTVVLTDAQITEAIESAWEHLAEVTAGDFHDAEVARSCALLRENTEAVLEHIANLNKADPEIDYANEVLDALHFGECLQTKKAQPVCSLAHLVVARCPDDPEHDGAILQTCTKLFASTIASRG